MFTSCTVISDQDVVRICQPEAGWGGVCIKERERGLSINYQVVFHSILRLCTILDEDCVALAIVVDVSDNPQVLDSVQSRSTID